MSQAVYKVCKHCKTNLPAAFFYKKEKSADGLQDWCKECQNQYNVERLAKISTRKHQRDLKRVSSYHLRYGLEYEFKDMKKNGHKRKVIIYKCLCCGKEVTSTIETAFEKKFKCNKCCLNNHSFKTITPEQTDQECSCDHNDNMKPVEVKTGFMKTDLASQKIIVVPVPLYKEHKRCLKHKTGFISWLKKLFRIG